MHKYVNFYFAEETKCEVAGWGNTNKKNNEYDYPKHLQYAKVPIRDTAQCRTDFFINSLSNDIVHLKNSNKSSALTWKNIKTIGKDSQYMYVTRHTNTSF